MRHEAEAEVPPRWWPPRRRLPSHARLAFPERDKVSAHRDHLRRDQSAQLLGRAFAAPESPAGAQALSAEAISAVSSDPR